MKTEPVCCWLNMLTEQQGSCLVTAQRDNRVSLISAGCWFQSWNLESTVTGRDRGQDGDRQTGLTRLE